MLVAVWSACQCSGWSTASMAGPMTGWLAVWLSGWLAGWLHGCTAARLHGCTAARLHGCIMVAWLHGWLSSWYHTISWFTVLGVEKHQHACARASLPPLHKIRQSLPLCHASAQHSTQHTAHGTAQHSTVQWFLGGKCLVLINTVFNASPTPSP